MASSPENHHSPNVMADLALSQGVSGASFPVPKDSADRATDHPWWKRLAGGVRSQAQEDVVGLSAVQPRTLPVSRTEEFVVWLWQGLSKALRFLGSILGVTFVLAWIATVPLVQLLTLGFLVEVTHRVIVSGRLRDGIVGRQKGWFLFKLLMGISLSLLPLYLVSRMRFDAWLIAPNSGRHLMLLRGESILLALTALHLLGAGLCGARLRHFLWPILVPWYLTVGITKRLLGLSLPQKMIRATVGYWFPNLVARFFSSQPLSEWFVPAVLWRHVRRGTLLSEASHRFWTAVATLRLWHYARQGFGALLGVTLWFAGPTFWVLCSTRSVNPGAQGIFYMVFLLHLFLVLLYFPFVHARYCQTLKMRSYFQWRRAGRTFQYSPMRLTLAMLFSLLLSSPLWLMRIAMVPYDLWWVFSLFYVGLLWPAWILWGWGTHHGQYEASMISAAAPEAMTPLEAAPAELVAAEAVVVPQNESPFPPGHETMVATAPLTIKQRCHLFWIWPWRMLFIALVLVQLFLTVLSIYICWQGAFNVMLHPMFHIPTPFGPNA